MHNLIFCILVAGFSCPPGSVHDYFADVTNCGNFYHCSDGNAYLQSCKDGLYFNPNTKVCDFPSNVRCSGTVVTGAYQHYNYL